MRIEKFHVRDFRSLRDSGEVPLDPSLTLLLGKNENGKTNLLRALAMLDRDKTFDPDEDMCRYSPVRAQLDAGQVDPATVAIVSAWFTLEGDESSLFSTMHKDFEDIEAIAVTKYLDNHYEFEVDHVTFGADAHREPEEEPDATPNLLEDAETSLSRFVELIHASAARHPPLETDVPALTEAVERFRSDLRQIAASSGDPVAALQTLRDQFAAVSNADAIALEEFSREITAIENQSASLASEVARVRELAVPTSSPVESLIDILPRFVYFNDIDLLEDRVTLSEFVSDPGRWGTLRNLFQLTGLDIASLQSQDQFKRQITGLVNES